METRGIGSGVNDAPTLEPAVSGILDQVLQAENPPHVFIDKCNEIAELAANRTRSEMGILYLTADQKILEAVGRHGEHLGQLLREDIPFYRLDWDVVPGYEHTYDGFTAWLAVHLRPGCYDVRVMTPVLQQHPSHKGQWDSIVWRGEAPRYLDRILSVSIGQDFPATGEYRCFGLLKVEREREHGIEKPFAPEDVKALLKLGSEIAAWLGEEEQRQRRFWQVQARAMAGRKAAQFLTLFARGRSIGYNVTEGVGFITEFFRILLGAEHAFHVFHGEQGGTKSRRHSAALPYWRPAYRPVRWETADDEAGMFTSYPLKEPTQEVPWRKESVRPRLLRSGDLDRDRDSMDHCSLSVLSTLPPQNVQCLAFGWEDLLKVIERVWNETPEKGGTVADVEAQDLNVTVPLPGGQNEWLCQRISGAKLIRLLSSERDLGTIIVPAHERDESAGWSLGNEEIAGLASTLARTFGALLSSQYDVPGRSETTRRLPSVYLPSIYGIGSKWVAILFADIRGFSRLTQMLRLLGEKGALESLMDFYSLQMAETISFWGRRDKFMGDGLMALFGEELGEEPEENRFKVVHAICCACETVLVFDKIMSMWRVGDLNEELLPWRSPLLSKVRRFDWTRIQREFAEEVDLESVRLAIGINFGCPYFDHFGDTRRREYTPVGDQVNLAKRLEEQASRTDDDLGRVRAPILMSQTAWSYAWNEGQGVLLMPRLSGGPMSLSWSPLRVRFPGMAFEYPAYELEPDFLNLDKIREIIRNSEGEERAKQLPFDRQADGKVTLSKQRLTKLRRFSRSQGENRR
jgi:class 3 adenylate cyclase